MQINPTWEYVADGVMGGVSQGELHRFERDGRTATRLTGAVSLENNGGFLQMACDLAGGDVVDASSFEGIALDVCGNGERYDVRLRTDRLTRPWQSFRAKFFAARKWRTVHLPFADFLPHKTEERLDPGRLRRVGIVAVGRAFEVDIAVSGLRFYG